MHLRERDTRICPFLRESESGTPVCLAQGEGADVKPMYVASFCSKSRHFTCQFFVRGSGDVKRNAALNIASEEMPLPMASVDQVQPIPQNDTGERVAHGSTRVMDRNQQQTRLATTRVSVSASPVTQELVRAGNDRFAVAPPGSVAETGDDGNTSVSERATPVMAERSIQPQGHPAVAPVQASELQEALSRSSARNIGVSKPIAPLPPGSTAGSAPLSESLESKESEPISGANRPFAGDLPVADTLPGSQTVMEVVTARPVEDPPVGSMPAASPAPEPKYGDRAGGVMANVNRHTAPVTDNEPVAEARPRTAGSEPTPAGTQVLAEVPAVPSADASTFVPEQSADSPPYVVPAVPLADTPVGRPAKPSGEAFRALAVTQPLNSLGTTQREPGSSSPLSRGIQPTELLLAKGSAATPFASPARMVGPEIAPQPRRRLSPTAALLVFAGVIVICGTIYLFNRMSTRPVTRQAALPRQVHHQTHRTVPIPQVARTVVPHRPVRPAAMRSWHFLPVQGAVDQVILTLYNSGTVAVTATVRAPARTGAAVRTVLVPAAGGVELNLDATTYRESLQIDASAAIVPTRMVVARDGTHSDSGTPGRAP